MRWRHSASLGLAAVLLLATASGGTAEPQPIGTADSVVRQVRGSVDGRQRDIQARNPVFWQEQIETDADSAATLVFLDRTTLTTGANSRVKLDEFVYTGGRDADAEKVAVSVSKGLMRFVTGSMKASAYEFRTPTAIIGVRGTEGGVQLNDGGNQEEAYCFSGICVVRKGGKVYVLQAGQFMKFRGEDVSDPAAFTSVDSAALDAAKALAVIFGVPWSTDLSKAADAMGDAAALRQLIEAAANACPPC